MLNMHPTDVDPADSATAIASHIQACRQRIPQFVTDHYAWPGAWQLNRKAWGWDLAIAPLNFLLGFPNFLLHLGSLIAEWLGLHRAASGLRHWHLGLPTKVQQHLASQLQNTLLDLPERPDNCDSATHRVIASLARQPAQLYIQTRNVAADITAGSIAAILGLILFSQFTPGSISAGSLLAKQLAKQQAIGDFLLGERLGELYYSLFPVSPSLGMVAVSLLTIMSVIAVVAAFSGIIHDPIQSATGIHQRRLNQMLNAIEASTGNGPDQGYRPKDTFVGRIYDLLDWIKGILSF
ncbi:MAG: hypothetical protein P8163_05105 [Candidatus Thiodiazotropha sp.]